MLFNVLHQIYENIIIIIQSSDNYTAANFFSAESLTKRKIAIFAAQRVVSSSR